MNTETQTQSVLLEYDLPYPPAKVWRALTEPDLLAKWLMPNDMQPIAGRSFTFKVEPTQWWDGIVNCKVLEIVQEQLIRYTWCSGPENAPLDTVVTFTLAPTSTGGTHLTLDHSGFVPASKFAFAGALKGWQHMAGTLLGEVLAQLQ